MKKVKTYKLPITYNQIEVLMHLINLFMDDTHPNSKGIFRIGELSYHQSVLTNMLAKLDNKYTELNKLLYTPPTAVEGSSKTKPNIMAHMMDLITAIDQGNINIIRFQTELSELNPYHPNSHNSQAYYKWVQETANLFQITNQKDTNKQG